MEGVLIMNSHQDEVLIRKMTDRQIIKRLLRYSKGYQKPFFIAFFFLMGTVILDLIFPTILGWSINLLEKNHVLYIEILLIIAIASILVVVYALFQYYQSIILQRTGQKIIYNLREEVFVKIENLSIAEINKTPIGKLVTRVTNDTNALNDLYTNILVNLFKNFFSIIAVIIAMLIVSVKLTLITLALAPLVAIFSLIFHRKARIVHRDVKQNITNVNAFLSENLSGMKITQVFNQEEKKLSEFNVLNNNLKKSSLKEILIFGIFRPSIYILYLFTVILVLYFGSKEIINLSPTMKLSSLVIFYQFIILLFTPIQQLAEQFNVLQSAFASSERIFEILDTPFDIIDDDNAIELTNIKGEIEFQNVWFSYVPDEWVLKDVCFKIKANETVAFVGATGSGKTTILSLIVRNYDIQHGRILIDGIDIKKIKISSLRSHIGQMLQDVFLFSGTITSNITMRDDTISFDEVVQACKYVNANHFIEKLPQKYNEIVQERGNNFSTGQRQLLSFARTIVHKPSILILDEATANIDTETEVLIQDSLNKMMNIGTMLIVAHRLSTIQHADKIIVLRKGKIIEEGTHQQLIVSKGHYQNLYQLQYQKHQMKKD